MDEVTLDSSKLLFFLKTSESKFEITRICRCSGKSDNVHIMPSEASIRVPRNEQPRKDNEPVTQEVNN